MTTKQQTESPPPNLKMSRLKAARQLASRITKGKEFLSETISTSQDYQRIDYKHTIWHEFNTELLRRMFDSDELSRDYSFLTLSWAPSTLSEKIEMLTGDIATHIKRLESIKERLPLYPELPEISGAKSPNSPDHTAPNIKEVFLVHGADHGVKDTVARYLAKLNLNPIILHEQPNLGDTIIEKLERRSPVAFSVVLLTPDDKAFPISNPSEPKSRARQNVVFELGFFIGRLGRGKVCALYTERVELPSDFQGVVYIPYDASGAWKLSLAKELKASGLDIDLNNAL